MLIANCTMFSSLIIIVFFLSMQFTFYMMAKNILSMEPGKPEIEKIRREYTTFMQGVVSPPLEFPGTPYWKAIKVQNTYFTKKKTLELFH